MVGSGTANSESFKVTTPSDQEICLTRLFNAPRRLVFEAMTKPEHVKQWWGRLGEGYSVPVCEIDFRVGGAWRFVNRHPKGEVAFYGEYREIKPPSRVVFTEMRAIRPASQRQCAIRLYKCVTWSSHPEWRRAQAPATIASKTWSPNYSGPK